MVTTRQMPFSNRQLHQRNSANNTNGNINSSNYNSRDVANNKDNDMNSNNRLLSIPAFVNVEYKVGKKLGEGSFGIIFQGVNLFSNLQVAIKFESRKADPPQLRDESRAYKMLSGCEGIPNFYYFGQDGLHNMLIIDLLGSSLEQLFNNCNRKFSVKTVCMIAKRVIARIRTVHDRSLVYRDIKPDNFMTGRPNTENENNIFMVDFGMAKTYRDPFTKQHIPYKERRCLSGTARYMSINAHLGREQSRRDDLEAAGYMFVYFLLGCLPWQGLNARNNRQKYEMIGSTKKATPIEKLTENCPEELAKYIFYVRNLEFEEMPDYQYLTELFSDCLKRLGEADDGVFDWAFVKNDKNGSSSSAAPFRGLAGPSVSPRPALGLQAGGNDQNQSPQAEVNDMLNRHPDVEGNNNTMASSNLPVSRPNGSGNRAGNRQRDVAIANGSPNPSRPKRGKMRRKLRNFFFGCFSKQSTSEQLEY